MNGGFRRSRPVLLAMCALGVLALGSAAAQDPTRDPNARQPATSKAWTPPRTPDGQPDLQGVWLNSFATPFERPKQLEGRARLSDEEVAELARRAERLFKDGDADLPIGDNLFLAALAKAESFRSPTGANRSSAYMVERAFDNRTSLIVDPPDGRIPALTAEAQLRRTQAAAKDRAAAGPEDINNLTRCITPGVPRMGPAATGDPTYGYFQILQSAGYVVLMMETFHEARIVPLDGRPHLSPAVRQWNGDSRGRWDADTLIIDTTNFSPKSNFLGSADNLHLVERFRRVAHDRIDYQVTVDDPKTWTTPWTVLIRLTLVPAKLYEFACHEGNAGSMMNILATARAEERSR